MPQLLPLEQLHQTYLDHHRALNRSPKSIAHHQNTLISFRKFLVATARPEDSTSLTTETMQAFATWLRETPTRGWRGKTERSIHATHGALKDLRSFLRWLTNEGFVDSVVKVPVPKLP